MREYLRCAGARLPTQQNAHSGLLAQILPPGIHHRLLYGDSRSWPGKRPAFPMLRMLPVLPMLKMLPALPMLRRLPALPMLKMLPKLPILRALPALKRLKMLRKLLILKMLA